MVKAIKANAGVNDYHKAIGWGKTEQTIKLSGKNRRLDIADVEAQKGIEFKEYSSGRVYNSGDVKTEVLLDKKLVDTGWDIKWVFKGCSPSGPLEKSLKTAEIDIKIIP